MKKFLAASIFGLMALIVIGATILDKPIRTSPGEDFYFYGVEGTNDYRVRMFTIRQAATNAARVQGAANTNHAAAILEAATNHTLGVVAGLNFTQLPGTLAIAGDAIVMFATNTFSLDSEASGSQLTYMAIDASGLKFPRGDPGTGKVLTSDADGYATWQALPTPSATLTTNANQFGDSVELTVKKGALFTNTVLRAPTTYPLASSSSATVTWESNLISGVFTELTWAPQALSFTTYRLGSANNPWSELRASAGYVPTLYGRNLVYTNGGSFGALTNSGALVLSGLPGSGSFVAVDGSGNTFKTNAPSGSTNVTTLSAQSAHIGRLFADTNNTDTLTATNFRLASASTPGYVLAVQGDGVTIAPTNPSGGGGGSGGIVVGPSVSSNSVGGLPLYSVTAQPGFTNIAARPGQRMKGINLVLRPGNDWYTHFSNDSFFHFTTNDVGLAKGLGLKALRLISDQKAVYTNAISADLMIARYEFFVKHAATNGLDVYAVSGDGNRYDSPPTGAELTYMTNYTQRFASMLSSNSNVRGLDILQEIHPWDSDATELANATNAVTLLYQAAKRGAPNIPATFSMSLNSGNLNTPNAVTLVQLVNAVCDINDIHIYVSPYPGNLGWMTNYTKPFVIGEIGVNNAQGPLEQNWKYRHAVSLSTHPHCEGIFFWALTDQNTVGSDMWGWYTTNNALKASNFVAIGRSASAQRNAPFTVYLGTSDGNSEQSNVAAGGSTNLGKFYFRTDRPGRIEITGVADINPSATGLVIAGMSMVSLDGVGNSSGGGFTIIHGNTASGQRLTAGGSGEFQFTPGIYELSFNGSSFGGGAGEIYSPQSNAKLRITYDENP